MYQPSAATRQYKARELTAALSIELQLLSSHFFHFFQLFIVFFNCLAYAYINNLDNISNYNYPNCWWREEVRKQSQGADHRCSLSSFNCWVHIFPTFYFFFNCLAYAYNNNLDNISNYNHPDCWCREEVRKQSLTTAALYRASIVEFSSGVRALGGTTHDDCFDDEGWLCPRDDYKLWSLR